MTASQPRTAPRDRTGASSSRFSYTVKNYMALTKPRIIELLLVTTFPVMFLAQRGFPDFWLVVNTLVGGSLSAGAANTLNCYLDRDIDRLMARTQNRPLVTGEISPSNAMRFGIVLTVVSTLWLGFLVNWLSAVLSVSAILLYVIFYTLVLKRRTSQNIVWGGVAGCMPVLIGWAAVTESISWTPIVLFLWIFFWTPPHYWPLSMRFKDQYAAAGIPMLPVLKQDTSVARQIVAYAWATALISLVLVPVAGMGWIYLVTAILSGGLFLLESYKLLGRAKDPANATMASLKPMRLFHYSITYVTLLFMAVAIDPLVHLPLPTSLG
ncbi:MULTISPECIES: heme o synthase [Arsenicicoccus]|nr:MULTISPECIES: heme o synthase [Arsenicicoccus]